MSIKRVVFALSIGAVLGACTLQAALEQSAIDYNRAADRAQKELFLLNVARAHRREGMTFSGIGEMRGNFVVETAASLEIPFGGEETNYPFRPSAKFRTNPSIQIKPLTTQEFQRGILNDVDPQTLFHYWDDGWPKEVLLHVFIEKIVLSIKADKWKKKTDELKKKADKAKKKADAAKKADEAKKKADAATKEADKANRCPIGDADWVKAANPKFYECVFDNDPEDEIAFNNFQDLLSHAIFQLYEKTISGEPVGPSVEPIDLNRLKFVSAAHDGDLVLKEGNLVLKEGKLVPKEGTGKGNKVPEGEFFLSTPDSTTLIFRSVEKVGEEVLTMDVGAQKSDVGGKVYLRSPQGMIYYLGELVRAQEDRKRVVEYQRIYGPIYKICGPAKGEEIPAGKKFPTKVLANETTKRCKYPLFVPLFVGWTGDGAAEIEVEHKGIRYFISADKDKAGKTMLVMALVRQLFNINTKREDLPSTQTVVTTGAL